MKGPLCAGPVTGKLRSITEGRVRVESRNGSPWSPLAFFLLFSPHPHPEKKQMFWEVEAERRTVRRPHPLALESWGRGRPDCRPHPSPSAASQLLRWLSHPHRDCCPTERLAHSRCSTEGRR